MIKMEHYKNLSLESIIYKNDEGVHCIEQWKDIPNYLGLYQASNLSRIKSLPRTVYIPNRNILRKLNGTILSWNYKTKKYPQISLHNEKQVEIKSIHIIIGELFVPNPLNLKFLNHKNGIKSDPRINNLEWCTHPENILHDFYTGLIPNGERNHNSKLTNNQVKVIKRLFKINPKTNQRDICRKLNISPSVINSIYKGRKWKYIL